MPSRNGSSNTYWGNNHSGHYDVQSDNRRRTHHSGSKRVSLGAIAVKEKAPGNLGLFYQCSAAIVAMSPTVDGYWNTPEDTGLFPTLARMLLSSTTGRVVI